MPGHVVWHCREVSKTYLTGLDVVVRRCGFKSVVETKSLLLVSQVDTFPTVLCKPSLVVTAEKPWFGVMVSAIDRIAAQTMSVLSENCDTNILEEHLRQLVLALE